METLEELKKIIHAKAIIIMIMSTIQSLKKYSFLSFSITELVFILIPNHSWC